MKQRYLLAVLLAWLLGIATALAGVAVDGGWYEYRFLTQSNSSNNDTVLHELINNSGGWEPVPNVTPRDGSLWLRRPRLRVAW